MSALPKAARGPVAVVESDRVPLGRDRPQGAGDGGHHGLLPGSTGRLGPSEHGRCRRAGAASLRRPGHRGRSRVHLDRRRRAPPHRGAQALAGRSTGQGRERRSPPSPSGTASDLLRTFFERLRDWDYDDAPTRTLIFPGDFPQADEPLPKFLDDPTMEKFTAALASDPDPRRRVMVEILAQTGIRVGELSGLDDKAVTQLGDTFSLRIPVGKLHNDRYVPIGPELVEAHHRLPEVPGTEPLGTPGRARRRPIPSTGGPSIATSIGWPSAPASATSIPISSATRSPHR